MTSPRPTPRARPDSHDMRCLCGSLIARLVDGGVEIKCRRCQRVVRLPLEEPAAGARSID